MANGMGWPAGKEGNPPPQLPPEEDSSLSNREGGPSSDSGSDGEGVWPADVEKAFQEALIRYPACGRRKIISSAEGKMYGRNELIARYIEEKTGKARSRKQVSSHIQVLARKKSRELQGQIKDPHMKERAVKALACMSSAQIMSGVHHSTLGSPVIPVPPALLSPGPLVANTELTQFAGSLIVSEMFSNSPPLPVSGLLSHGLENYPFAPQMPTLVPPTASYFRPMTAEPLDLVVPRGAHSLGWANPGWATEESADLPLKLMELTVSVEEEETAEKAGDLQRHVIVSITPIEYLFNRDSPLETIQLDCICGKFQEERGGLRDLFDKGPRDRFFVVKVWPDLNSPLVEDLNALFAVTTQFQSLHDFHSIQCSTKVQSFEKVVLEKVETERPQYQAGRFLYRMIRSPMCEYMVGFTQRLKPFAEKFNMQCFLDCFTILQVVTVRETCETLLCLAYIFDESLQRSMSRWRFYRLV
uniref:TEAD conserved 2 n=1 Tax=Halisarca dujardinii TaxID=2583056 RepID=A0AA50AI95_HALDU|nr:TEAD conserved 2 [Halisarca dujardinii]